MSEHKTGHPVVPCAVCTRWAGTPCSTGCSGESERWRFSDGIEEAKEHGHPEWSHAMAYGPCTK